MLQFRLYRVIVCIIEVANERPEWSALQNWRVIAKGSVNALPALVCVGGLLTLLLFIYTILGTSLFYNAARTKNITEYANFESFGGGVLLLFRVVTGDGWTSVMDDLAKDACNDLRDEHSGSCGGRIKAAAFFYSFIIVATLALNLFVALMLDNIAQARTRSCADRIGASLRRTAHRKSCCATARAPSFGSHVLQWLIAISAGGPGEVCGLDVPRARVQQAVVDVRCGPHWLYQSRPGRPHVDSANSGTDNRI